MYVNITPSHSHPPSHTLTPPHLHPHTHTHTVTLVFSHSHPHTLRSLSRPHTLTHSQLNMFTTLTRPTSPEMPYEMSSSPVPSSSPPLAGGHPRKSAAGLEGGREHDWVDSEKRRPARCAYCGGMIQREGGREGGREGRREGERWREGREGERWREGVGEREREREREM